MSKYFIFENEKEIQDIIDSRLMSNGYSNYNFDSETEEITLQCGECGGLIKTNLPNIEDGVLESKCVYCVEIERNKKLTHQKEIAEILSWHHLNLISINEDDFYIKCEMCGKEYFSNKDFELDENPEKMYCKNLPCFLHTLFHSDGCNNPKDNLGIKIVDSSAYTEHHFIEDIYETVDDIDEHFQFVSPYDNKCKKLHFKNWYKYYDEIYHSYKCDEYKTGIYDEMNDNVEIICQKCDNIFFVTCEQYHNEDFDCRMCQIIDEKNIAEREVEKLNQEIIDLKNHNIQNITLLSNKNKCKLLKTICKELAKANGLIYLSAECPTPDSCNVDCSLYKAELSYLENELNKKIEKREKVSLEFLNNKINMDFSSIDLETHEKIYLLMHIYNEYRPSLMNSDEKEKILNMPIEELYLHNTAYNPLKRHGIKYIRELTQMTSEELRNVKSLNIRAYCDIIYKLLLLGLNLKG